MANTTTDNTNYNINPTASDWFPVWGGKPGQLAEPPSTFDQLNANVPYYGVATNTAMGDINSMLSGNLSPGTTSNIWNQAAARGVNLGQPNSPMSNNIGLNLTGNSSEQLQQQGLQDYGSITSLLGSQQNNPELLAALAEQNAVTAAAPDPHAAGGYATWLDEQGMDAGKNQQQTDALISALGSIVGGTDIGSLFSSGSGSGGSSGGGGSGSGIISGLLAA